MRAPLYILLAVVAAAAAVLSFDALHGLARLCGFGPWFAPLLPVTVDAGAAAGSLVWLSRPAGRARVFGRALALVLLVGSVAGNALGHGLAAYSTLPAWWTVVLVSAVPPAVLGAVVHLAVLAGRTVPAVDEAEDLDDDAGDGATDWWADAPPVDDDRATELIAAGVGRRRLARELDISEHQARELLAERRNGHRVVTS